MQLHKGLLVILFLSLAVLFGTATKAADMAKSGTIKTHIGIKISSVVVPVGEKHVLVAATSWGMIYNDAGSGPLHTDAWSCAFAADFDNGTVKGPGFCVSGDTSGVDRIFVTFSGSGTTTDYAGTGVITNGTGRYSGIQGKLAYQCKVADAAQGISSCTQQFDYQLP